MRDFLKANKVLLYLIGVVLFLVFFYGLFLSAPNNFPAQTTIRIDPGVSLRSVSLELQKDHLIKSRIAFEAFVIIFGRERVISGDYYFENKLPVYSVAQDISKGMHHIAPIAMTIPEGFDINQIADVVVPKLKNFNKNKFLTIAQKLEGYLFPDTYFFLSTDDESDVISLMSENFNKKITPLLSDISLNNKTEKEVVIMASLIEHEAKGDADRANIAGILWHRIAIGMALQVDAAKETYKKKGLPKSPIDNPGIESIKAAIYTKSSPYLYYLHDKYGIAHYASSFAEHEINIKKYLK